MFDRSDRPSFVGQIQTASGPADVVLGRYANEVLAVRFTGPDGGPLGTLSTNVPDHAHVLQPGEFFAKTYSENTRLADAALSSGLFEDTGRTIRCGYLTLPIWRVQQPAPGAIASLAENCHEG